MFTKGCKYETEIQFNKPPHIFVNNTVTIINPNKTLDFYKIPNRSGTAVSTHRSSVFVVCFIYYI